MVGLACDLVKMQVLLSLNGSFEAPRGVVFRDLSPDAVRYGLFAAFSSKRGEVRYNLGEAAFQYAPPADDFKGLAEFDSEVPLECSPCLLNACKRGDAGQVQDLIKSVANIDARDAKGQTCLMIADGQVVRVLLAAGAKPGLTDKHGMTALMLACADRREEAAKLLVEPTRAAGCLDVRSTALTGLADGDGSSALMWAEDQGLGSVAQMLRECGAAVARGPGVLLLR